MSEVPPPLLSSLAKESVGEMGGWIPLLSAIFWAREGFSGMRDRRGSELRGLLGEGE